MADCRGHHRGDLPRQITRSERIARDTQDYGPADDPMLPVAQPSLAVEVIEALLSLLLVLGAIAAAWMVTA
ncbi:MAG: hypothetical protein IT379_16750 [Deltaproteobacteria bacterium]|nr:hypothetical protein [Deltaproteobacteria bacterium]